MENLYEKAQQSAEYIQEHITKRPKIAVVLGSGLGNLTADFTETEELPYRDIPNFPVSTVEGHKGALLRESWEKRKFLRWRDAFISMKAIP